MRSFTFAMLLLGACTLSSFTFYSVGDEPTKTSGANAVQHRIELCSYSKSVPVKTVEQLRSIDGVIPVKESGIYTYYTAPYGSESDANQDVEKFKKMGFEGAKQVVQYNGKFISIEEYHQIDKGANTVRIWK